MLLIYYVRVYDRNLLGNGSVDVGNDNFIVVPPAENVTLAPRGALVRRGHTEHHLVHTFTEIQVFLYIYRKTVKFGYTKYN